MVNVVQTASSGASNAALYARASAATAALAAEAVVAPFNAGSAGKCKAVFSSFSIKQTHISFNKTGGTDSFVFGERSYQMPPVTALMYLMKQ